MSKRPISLHEPPLSVDTSTMQKSKPCSVSQIWSYSRRDPGGRRTGTPNIAVALTEHPEAPPGQPWYVPAGLSVKPNVPELAIGVTPQELPSVTQYAAAPDSNTQISAW